MRRIFAVAVSVGFATTLSKAEWIQHTRLPNVGEMQQLAVLLTALTATVASWDGYLVSIDKKPLERTGRYVIDVVLVFIYLLLLLTATNPHWWLAIIVGIFTLYLTWDVLSIREHFAAYRASGIPEDKSASGAQVAAIYRDGFLNRDVAKGPIITAMWWLYFLGLSLVDRSYSVRHQLWAMCAFAFAGLLLYRYDKSHAFNSRARGGLIAGLLVGINLVIVLLQRL